MKIGKGISDDLIQIRLGIKNHLLEMDCTGFKFWKNLEFDVDLNVWFRSSYPIAKAILESTIKQAND